MAKPILAVTGGDPAGIGPEIALKALADKRLRATCRPLLVGDAEVLTYYRDLLKIPLDLKPIAAVSEARFAPGSAEVLHDPSIEMAAFRPGTTDAAGARATLSAARRAIALALSGEVEAVVAGPHTQAAIAAAGISFDGYPGFVARETGSDPAAVFLMLVSEGLRIAHVTLHVGVRAALDLIRRERVLRALRATDRALRDLGSETPRIGVAGVNPHAGEGGLFGSEDTQEIAPAVAEARKEGIQAAGPFGADTLLLRKDFDGYLMMLHDQGHIPAKLLGFDRTSALTIGAPVRFATVAHGSGLDIAGKGLADPSCLIRTIERMAAGTVESAKTSPPVRRQAKNN
ncbi:MAG: 4-hydroxythreonine-4-phosphate dehydrogenase PdxA [SAR324 cluster bacterium]|nr:4-hydroxythreonine-4-phosphate dehydrogenase PdxA [SAR324 cluster bacterium]